MNRELFLAILAMDSYNRGYGQGITGLSNTGLIGNASILSQSDIRPAIAVTGAKTPELTGIPGAQYQLSRFSHPFSFPYAVGPVSFAGLARMVRCEGGATAPALSPLR